MTLTGRSTLYKHTKGTTLYLSIPARLADDSQFTFRDGDVLQLEFIPEKKTIQITKLEKRGDEE